MGAAWINNEEQLRNQKLIKNIRIHGPGRIKYNQDSIDIVIDDRDGGSGGSSGGASIPAKVLSKSGIYHICDLYENGIDNPPTREDQKVFVLQLNLAETLPVDTWIMVSLSSIGQTGGGNVP